MIIPTFWLFRTLDTAGEFHVRSMFLQDWSEIWLDRESPGPHSPSFCLRWSAQRRIRQQCHFAWKSTLAALQAYPPQQRVPAEECPVSGLVLSRRRHLRPPSRPAFTARHHAKCGRAHILDGLSVNLCPFLRGTPAGRRSRWPAMPGRGSRRTTRSSMNQGPRRIS
jgi:hypothetical protein